MIRGKLDKTGILYIERAGKLVEQLCPHGRIKNCSHYCPLMGEPFIHEQYGKQALVLCGSLVIVFDSFLDERKILDYE